NQFFVLSQPYISTLIFNIILKYLYCGIIELNDLDIDTILKLLVAVNELLIEELIDFIQDCLIGSDFLETQSCKILNFISNKSMFTKLKKSIFETICEKPKVLFNHDEFLDLEKDLLKLVIQHDDLDMKKNEIWKYLIKWNLIEYEIALILTKLIDKTKDEDSKEFKYKFTLLYNSHLDGWTPKLFHTKCDNQGPTIVVTKIKNTTLLIGGYNPFDWNGNSQYKKTTDSFLFIIDYKKISDCYATYIKLDHIDQAIYCNNDCNPTFGEYDFHITKDKSLKYIPKYYDNIANNCTYSLDRTIGAEKTTCAKLFEDYLKQKGFSVYQFIEASLEVSEELELFYKTQNFLFFQYVVINLYKERALHIKTLINYDYIIKDHTIRDVNIFNNFVKNEDEREYVNKKVIETDHLEFYKIVYVDPPLRITTRRKKKRGRLGETCSNEYLKQIYTLYETSIDTIYPEHIKFDNKIVLCKDCIDFKPCQKKCDRKSYDLFFNQLL
ncbi:2764_t:CDS:2, partial [Cetraspora pellucida]